MKELEDDLAESGFRSGGEDLFGDPRSNQPAGVTARDRQILAQEVMSLISIGRYALKSDIPPPSRPQDMSRYVTHRELQAFDYVDQQYVATAITGATTGPSPVEARVKALEDEVSAPGGAFARMEKTMQEMMTKKIGESVSAGPYTFKDIAATELWASTIDATAKDLDSIKYFIDARQLLGSMNTSDKTVSESLQEAADSRKGGYNDTASAMIGVSFGIINPETIFKKSNADKHASQGGVVFTAQFSSYDVFEGDFEFSTLKKMLARLEAKRHQHQRSIGAKFPPDQVKHAKTHAVCSIV